LSFINQSAAAFNGNDAMEKVYNSCVRHINQKIKSLSACVPRPLHFPSFPLPGGHICQLNVCNFKIFRAQKTICRWLRCILKPNTNFRATHTNTDTDTHSHTDAENPSARTEDCNCAWLLFLQISFQQRRYPVMYFS